MKQSGAKTPLQKSKPLFPYLSIPLILLVVVLLISIVSPPPRQYVEGRYGEFDLRGLDLENYTAFLAGPSEHIPDALLSPAEFEAWEGERFFGGESLRTAATSRIRIYVEDGTWYTFFRNSIDYSHRIYVNGEWLLDIGRPGESQETDTPNTGRITFTAQGVDGVIELVQQSSNHVHRSGGSHNWWNIGTSATIFDWERAEQYQTNIILGSFLMLAVLFFVLFLTHGRNPVTLYFAMFCIAWFMRMGVIGGRVFTVIFPQMDWFTKFRIEYIVIPVSAILTLAIVNIIFKNILHKPVLYSIYGISAVFIALFMFLDTVIMRDVLDAVFVVYGVAIVWLFGCLFIRHPIRRKKLKQHITNTEQIIFLFGLMLFIVAALVDFGYFVIHINLPPFHMTGVAMLVFALCEAAAVFTTMMNRIEKTKERQRQHEAEELRLQASNDALETLSRMKTEFLATISHELKTPLTVISNNAQLARMHAEDDRKMESGFISETMRLITGDAERMNMLINQLLDASRVEEGRLSYKFVRADIAALIRDTIGTFKTELNKKNNNLILHLPEGLKPVYCDRERIYQVLMNLLSNANRFTKGGKITISVEEKQSFISISVADTGEGIPEAVRETIFDRYTTANPKSDKSLSGTGLGLYISKHIIETHGGAIRAESENGQGTVMSFTLPVYEEESNG